MSNFTQNTPTDTSPTRNGILSAEPNQAIQQMMETIDVLRGVYEKETEALDSADTATFFDLQDHKMKTAQLYQSGINELLTRSDELKTVRPDLKEKLAMMQEEFSVLAKRNLDAISRMNRCVERLGDTLRSAAKESAKKQQAVNYDQSGKLGIDDKKLLTTGVSETA